MEFPHVAVWHGSGRVSVCAMSWASSERTARSMRSNRGRDTGPERAVRTILHAEGFRYRVDFAPLGGRRRADIVFTRPRVAIFIDGCFWHCCPAHGTQPRQNADYWLPKLRRNVERDRETDASLRDAGWTVLRFWEHEDPSEIARQISETLQAVA
ncbi:very short patch repair endonuclease [Microbacterium sp. BE35]|uniref:very short patch repair endonuclease n=1 Tax=Microbacterium sp. BE35 TaxID=2817773 RepID=UPI00286C4F25|nr:very short patch repair endonuclease [Microbacterium sp. BE35]